MNALSASSDEAASNKLAKNTDDLFKLVLAESQSTMTNIVPAVSDKNLMKAELKSDLKHLFSGGMD